MAYITSYYSKQNPIEQSNTEKVVKEVLLYVFNTAFPPSLLYQKGLHVPKMVSFVTDSCKNKRLNIGNVVRLPFKSNSPMN